MRRSFAHSLKAPLLTALGFSLLINVTLLTPSLYMLLVFDRVLSTQSVETLVMFTVIAALTLALMGFLEQLRSRALGAMGLALERQQGPRLLRQLLAGSARGAGAPYVEGMRDLGLVRSFLSGSGVTALFDAPWIVVYVVVIALFHPLLGALALLFAVLLLALAYVNERWTRASIASLQSSHRQASRHVDTALRHAEVITALGMPSAVARRWEDVTLESHSVQLEVSRVGGIIGAVSRVARQMVQVLMLGVGAWLVISNAATPGVMLACTIILGRALAPVEQLIGGWKALVEARAAFGRLSPILDRPDEGAVGVELPRPSGQLDVVNLSYAPPGSDKPLLNGVSLSVRPGQALALVGASGAGKTTLARLLVGVLQPGAGVVRLDGADLRMWEPERLGAWLGYLPQNVALFAGTIGQNIARLGEADSADVLNAARLAHAHEMILKLPHGYETEIGDDGVRLSGGQRQRVALARAVYGRPALVVLDEPDASLDSEGEQALLETIRQLKAAGSTVVVISQRRAVLAVADLVAVMRDGQIDRVAAREGAVPEHQSVASVQGGQREGQSS